MPTLTLASVVSHPSHPIQTDVAGETVLMSLARSRCYGLGETGSAVWRQLRSPIRVRDLVARLNEEYDAEPGTIERDVLDLLQELADEGLIDVHG